MLQRLRGGCVRWFCLALGLTVAACTTANAGIDKSTVEAGRLHIKGKIDASHDLVVRIDRGDKPIEWRSSRTGGGEFEVVVEASDKIRLEDGKTGHGFVVTTNILTSSNINYVHCGGDLAGTFAIRRETDFVTKDGVFTFADVTLKDGKKLPVSLRLAISRTAVPVRADDKAALPAQAPDEKEIERVIRQLASDDVPAREAATKKLAEMGEPALAALQQTTTSDDLEVRTRAEEIITVIETKLYPELILRGHTSSARCLCVSADGTRVLTGSGDRTLRLWDAHTGECLRVFKGHTDCVNSAALSPDGQRVLSGSEDWTVRLWDAKTGQELAKMTVVKLAGSHPPVAFGPEGQAIFGGGDGKMHLWDLNTHREAGVFTGHIGAPSVWVAPDGKRRLSAAPDDNAVRILDVETGKELWRINAPNPVCVAFSPDGKRIVTGGYEDMKMRVWDVATGKELCKYEGHRDGVTCVTYFPNGKRIVSTSYDGTAHIWRAPRTDEILPEKESKSP